MKRWSILLVIKPMQIKTWDSTTYLLVTENRNSDHNKYRWGHRILTHCCWECKMLQLLWKTVWQLLKRLNMHLSYYPVISLLDINPRKMEADILPNISTQRFMAALSARQLQVHQKTPGYTQTVVHPHNEVLLSNKKEGTIPWLVKSMGSEQLRIGMPNYELCLD